MNVLNVPLVAAIGGALIVLGCDRERPPIPEANAAAQSEAQRPPPPVNDPSVPPASSAVGATTGPTARDAASTQPNAPMTKQEESSEMPKANQANNHSSTALDPKTNKP